LDSKLFKPSIDWSSALQDSLRWLAIAWVIGAVCLLAALVAARYLTPWGRQFWRITRGYFVGPTSVRAWLGLGVLLLLVLFSVRLNVLFSYQSNDMWHSKGSPRGTMRSNSPGSTTFGSRSEFSSCWRPSSSPG
jgi:putative ATP-binding cassette transporter